MSEPHPDPGGESAARAAQLAAMTLSVAEAVARLRAQRLLDRAHDDQTAAGQRAAATARATADRLTYTAALGDDWLRRASTSDLLAGWTAAGQHTETDPAATRAVDRIEERLRRLHPEAMTAYDAARAGGFTPADCLDVAATLTRGEYGLDPIGTPTAWATNAGVMGTPPPDQSPDGPTESVARQAFPVGIHDAMTTAPTAAASRLALTAQPARRQLTAASTPPTTTQRSTR